MALRPLGATLLLVLAACGQAEQPTTRGREPTSTSVAPAWARVSQEQLAEAERVGRPVAFENALGMRFVLIPAGTFTMGSPPDEADRESIETAHAVTLARPYYLQVTEVTNRQIRRWRPEHRSGESEGRSLDADEQPVVNVSWEDATAFARWLSDKDGGLTYRLPTEAEWERACRAGTSTPFWWGNEPSAQRAHLAPWPSRAATLPVGTLEASPWGLHDMHGNASEWCADRHDDNDYAPGPLTDPTGPAEGDARARRGGACDGEAPHMMRAAFRSGVAGGEARAYVGLRLAATVAGDRSPR